MSPSGLRCALSFAVFIALLARGQFQSWSSATCLEKYEECSNLYNNPQHNCMHYNQTILCFGNYSEHNCIAQSLVAKTRRNHTIKRKFCPSNCIPNKTLRECIDSFFPNLTTLITPPPPPENCTYSPTLPIPTSLDDPPLIVLGYPSLLPPPSPPECTPPDYETNYRQHCSMFSLTHIRSFGDRSLPLQTCTLLGKVYLLKHNSLSVSIDTSFKQGNSNFYTYITEVNVTLHHHHCFQHTVTYTATADDLPESIPGLDNTKLSLLKLTVENNSVATILAPWINATIVIHRTGGYLSATLQVPESLSHGNAVTGLCTEGCPTGFDVADATIDLPDYKCTKNRVSSAHMCLSLDVMAPLSQFTPMASRTYSHLCTYDLLLTHDLGLLSLYQALGEAALQLPDVTERVTTLPTSPDTMPPTDPPEATIVLIPRPVAVDLVPSSSICTVPLINLPASLLAISLLLR